LALLVAFVEHPVPLSFYYTVSVSPRALVHY